MSCVSVKCFYILEEAAHLAKMMAYYGYIHTVPDSKLIVKDDATCHRFQVWKNKRFEAPEISNARGC